MKIGRNDPCPCGSGKKYKKCCLGKQSTTAHSLYYRRLSEAYDRLMNRLIPFAIKTFGEEALGLAMNEFLLWPDPESEIDDEALDRMDPLFLPWFMFNWEYDPAEAEVELQMPMGRTMAELYADERGSRLDPLERKLIEGSNRIPYRFWEVLYAESGRSIRLMDVLTGSRVEVQERSGSGHVKPGDLLFGRAAVVDGVGMLTGLAPTIIPPGHKPDIIQLRTKLRGTRSAIDEDDLDNWHLEIRELYFQIDRSLYSRPQLCNTDGDPIEFHRLVYEVPSAQEAFEHLGGLCVTSDAEALLGDAKRDAAGEITRIEFTWDRLGHEAGAGFPNTILGRIVIDGNRLSAEVNSARRANDLRSEIQRRMGEKARFRLDEIKDTAPMIEGSDVEDPDGGHSAEHEELMQLPEVREHLEEFLRKHWEGWAYQPIPALRGKTPSEAVSSADGREAVEALLRDAERDRGNDPFIAEANRKGVRRVRKLLGLDDIQ